jgi:hypothetical protein
MVEGIAAASTALATQQVQAGVAVRMLEQANSQQECAVSLLEGAMELAAEIQRANQSHRIDVKA